MRPVNKQDILDLVGQWIEYYLIHVLREWHYSTPLVPEIPGYDQQDGGQEDLAMLMQTQRGFEVYKEIAKLLTEVEIK